MASACDIGQWRDLVVYKTECKETADRMEIVQWKIREAERVIVQMFH